MSQSDLCVPTVGVFTNDPAHPSGPGPFLSPICYTIPPAEDVLNAFLSTTLNPDGSVNTQTIVDGTGTPIAGAVLADCPTGTGGGGGGGGGFALAVQNQGVQITAAATCLNFTGAGVTAAVAGGCIDVTIPGGGGGLVFPILAPNGTGAAPSYSFSGDTDSGLLRIGTSMILGFNNLNARLEFATTDTLLQSTAPLVLNSSADTTLSGVGTVTMQATGVFPTGGQAIISGANMTGDAILLRTFSSGGGIADIAFVTGGAFPGTQRLEITGAGVVDFTGTTQIRAPNGTCAAPIYSFVAAQDSGMFHDAGANNVTIGNDNCDSFVRVGPIIRIEAANGDFVEYGASMLTQIAGGTRIQLSQAAPIVGRGVSNLFSLFAAGDTQAALVIGGNSTATAPAGEGWLRGGDSNFAGQNGAHVVIDAGDANAAGSIAGDCIVSAGRGTAGGTPGNIVWRTNALTRARLMADGSYEWGGSVGTAGQFLTSAGVGAPPTWQNGPAAFPGYGTPVSTGQANAAGVALTVARSDHVHRTLVEIDSNAAVVASRPKINFIPGGGITINAVDNAGQDRVDVTIAATGSAVSVWMARDVEQSNGTRVMAPGFEAQTQSDTPKGFSAPRAGTYRNLRVRHQTAQGNGTAVTYTLRLNGVATALTVSLATGAVGTASNLVNTVAVAAGDLIEMIRVNPANLGNGQVMAAVSAEFA